MLYDESLCLRYIRALEKEIEQFVVNGGTTIEPKTVYIGGGTPTLLPSRLLETLLKTLHKYIDLDGTEEWTVEATPETLYNEHIGILCDHKVTRVSMGAQSMNNAVLEHIERRHDASKTERSVNRLRAGGIDNIGLDLIACLPGESDTSWVESVKSLISLNPKHISVYALSADPGSHLHELRQRGEWQPQETEQEQATLAIASELLLAAGYEQYEVSNYAKPGHHCQHNVAVWEGRDFIGFGPAAASRVGQDRWQNTPDLLSYCSAIEEGHLPPRNKESVSPETDVSERLMFAFRLCRGVNLDEFTKYYGEAASNLHPTWLAELHDLKQAGLATTSPEGHWKLTPQGLNCADTIATHFLP